MRPDLHISEDMTLGAGTSYLLARSACQWTKVLELKADMEKKIFESFGVPPELLNKFLATGVRTATGYDFMHGNMHLI